MSGKFIPKKSRIILFNEIYFFASNFLASKIWFILDYVTFLIFETQPIIRILMETCYIGIKVKE